MEATSQQMTATPSQPSAMPTAVAQQSAAQFATSQGQPLPALNLGATAGGSPSSPGLPAGSGPAGFGGNTGGAGQSVAGGVPGAQRKSEYKQPLPGPGSVLGLSDSDTPQFLHQPAGVQPQQLQQAQAQYLEQPTYSPQASTQAYSQPSSEAAPARDAYLSQISDESLEVLEHFGAEAPNLLNNYACAVEDALIEQVQRGQSMNLMLEAAGEERTAMNIMLTDPDVLADYVNEFFGPEGPYPTPTQEELASMQQEAAQQQFADEIAYQEQTNVPQNFQRPAQEFPTPNRSANPVNNFWDGFSSMMDNNPEDAWKYLSQAPGAAFQQKMLVQDT